MTAFMLAVWDVVLALAPWLLLGAAIAGALHVLLPPDFVRRHLGGRGGVLKAVALGVPLPLCSCGVIPAGLGLKKDGASDGSTVAFLISTPQTGVDSVLVSASFLGWPFAIFKLASAAVTGLVGGLLADRGRDVDAQLAPHEPTPPADRSARAAVAHALDVMRSIWRWLVFGIVASAAITVFIPTSWLQSVTEHGALVAMLAALVVSIPLYVCATASVPVAAALVAGGFPPGAALVFLMAGPATNVATLGAVHRVLGRKMLAIYLSTIVVGSLALGWAFDFVLRRDAVAMAHLHGDPGVVTVAASALFIGLLAWFAIDDLRGVLAGRGKARADEGRSQAIQVEGMTCQGCVRKLEGQLRSDPAVTHVHIDLAAGRAEVTGIIAPARLHELVRQAGYRVPGADA